MNRLEREGTYRTEAAGAGFIVRAAPSCLAGGAEYECAACGDKRIRTAQEIRRGDRCHCKNLVVPAFLSIQLFHNQGGGKETVFGIHGAGWSFGSALRAETVFYVADRGAADRLRALADKVLSPHRNGPLSVLDGDRFHEVVALVCLLLNPESPA